MFPPGGPRAIALLLGLFILLQVTALNEASVPLCTTVCKTYRKYDASVTQPQAIEACKQLGGRLALPTNKKEDDQIRKEIGIDFNDDKWEVTYWISGDDQEEEGTWVDTVTGEPLCYTNFESPQPDNAGSGEDFLIRSPSYHAWNDVPGSFPVTGYVCEFINE